MSGNRPTQVKSLTRRLLFDWLRNQPCDYAFSLNGSLGDQDRTVDVPRDLFNDHILLDNGVSTCDPSQWVKSTTTSGD